MTNLSRRSLLAASVGASVLAAPAILRAAPPTPVTGRLRHLAYTDQGGRPDGVQVMVSRQHAFVGHMFSNGITVIDVADPTQPKPVKFWAAPANTRTHHIQAMDDMLLAVAGADIPTIGKYNPSLSYYEQSFANGMKGKGDFAAGLLIFDIKTPAEPKQIGFLEIPGIGLNRLWWPGGRYAYLSAHMDGFTDHILVIADIADPTKPKIVGRWWIPGMWHEGGEKPSWAKGRVALHHMIVANGIGYAAWRDGGFTILDVSDPTNIKLISHVNTFPAYPGGTHTPLPLPGRDLALILDESSAFACSKGLSYTWVYDVRDKTDPVSIATLPTPHDQDWCRPGENFGPHNMHENRPGTFQSETTIFATYHNAGLRVFDLSNQYAPVEIASYVPPPPTKIIDPRPGYALAPMCCDVNVQKDGTVFLSDWNAGLHVLNYNG